MYSWRITIETLFYREETMGVKIQVLLCLLTLLITPGKQIYNISKYVVYFFTNSQYLIMLILLIPSIYAHFHGMDVHSVSHDVMIYCVKLVMGSSVCQSSFIYSMSVQMGMQINGLSQWGLQYSRY